MKKYTMLILCIVISILTINSGTVLAIDVTPEIGNCAPDMYIEISGDVVYFDPLISTDCQRSYWIYGNSWYALLDLILIVEHQRLIDGVWQAGPRTNTFEPENEGTYSYTNPHFLYAGGVTIEGYNTTDYDRYRFVAILEGGVRAFLSGGNSQIMYRTDEYVADWIYGLNATSVNPTLDDSPNGFADQPDPDDEIPDRPTVEVNPNFDDVPDGFADQDDPDNELPDRPADSEVNPDLDDAPDGFADQDGTRPEDEILIRPTDRDRDGIPDATDQCPDVAGPVVMQGCPVSVDGISNGRQPNLPSTGFVCTVETSMAMTFFFDVVPGNPVPLGTTPIALTSINISDTNQVVAWETARLSFDGVEHEYMIYPSWSSLARTGGTCGEFSGLISAVSS